MSSRLAHLQVLRERCPLAMPAQRLSAQLGFLAQPGLQTQDLQARGVLLQAREVLLQARLVQVRAEQARCRCFQFARRSAHQRSDGQNLPLPR